ncbi:TetR/AcrR family transcriptional regulator [Pseudomonas abietaniphila]|jgi:AcrR family transcriptional regulator|uniref:Transcriptional regulator, TetR family n=1 Tax=Pseudomonas abietaniphila TaxID=89065 RepID=A0A1G7RP36_9PSED|nr:TetR/AcrR family transcriptional regulator [Pseudomonas abietaniphila]SDG12578.1 transcriptional regulator, TetR family [Pseudomonas abietaniphila]
MARPREFDEEQALNAAVEVFREHGFEGTSAVMLTESMRIGRQSLYATFGDKWNLYLAALRHYSSSEVTAHLATVRGQSDGYAGIAAFLDRVVHEAHRGCLGIGSICEFGDTESEISQIRQTMGSVLRNGVAEQVRIAQSEGHISPDLDPESVVDFLLASVTGIRIAARGGADQAHLASLKEMALRALR